MLNDNKFIEKLNSNKDSEKQSLDLSENISRRAFIKKAGLSVAGLGALSMFPSTSALNIRTSNSLNYFGNDQSNPNFSVQPDGSLEADSLKATSEIVDGSGTSHTGQLADDGDTQPPENHGESSHDGSVPVDGTGTGYEIQKNGTDGTGIINFKTG